MNGECRGKQWILQVWLNKGKDRAEEKMLSKLALRYKIFKWRCKEVCTDKEDELADEKRIIGGN